MNASAGMIACLWACLAVGCSSLPWSDSGDQHPAPMPRTDAPSRVGPLAQQPAQPVAAASTVGHLPPGTGNAAADVFVGAPTHGAESRARGQQLDGIIAALLKSTLPAVEAVQAGLQGALARLTPPETLASTETALRDWHADEIADYQAKVDALYDVARLQLERLYDLVLITAERQAVALAPPRTLLDDGPTGDRALDTRLTALSEVMVHATRLLDLTSEREQDRGLEVELIEVFNTFANGDAEQSLDGRLLLFIGGDEFGLLPRCLAVYRHDGPGDVGDYAMAQVVRHRIMRGDAVVHDLGWRPSPGAAPGFPATESVANYLLAPNIRPFIDTQSAGFDQLRDMRIVVDTQTAVIGPDGQVLSGVDWRVQFSVSTRGDLSWDISGGRPVYDPWCTHVKELLGQSGG